MAARGAIAKENVANKILTAFPGAFKYDKEIRVPMEENGENIQIKVVLTAAKVNVESGGDVAVPGATKTVVKEMAATGPVATKVPVEPTEEEKKNVASLLNMLGL